jgi:hypothetical protein
MTENVTSYSQENDFESFLLALPELLKSHEGEAVVFHDGKPIEFFDHVALAVVYGDEKFGPGRFIAQVIEPSEPQLESLSLAAMAT